MKPLVLWCRWHEATLRLHGRSEAEVWGELAFKEKTKAFRFDLEAWVLTVGEGEAQERLQLDEMGVERDAHGGRQMAHGEQ